MVGQGNWLPPPVALGKVPSYPVEHRLVKSTRTGEPVILSEHQIASGRDVPLAGGHVMVSIQDRSQDRGGQSSTSGVVPLGHRAHMVTVSTRRLVHKRVSLWCHARGFSVRPFVGRT